MNTDQFLDISRVLPEAMYLVSGSGKILATNPAGGKMLGLTHQSLSGKQLNELVADPFDKVDRYLRTWSKSKDPVPGALKWHHFDGRTIDCRCSGSTLTPSREDASRRLLLHCKEKKLTDSRFASLNRELDSLRVRHHKLMDDKDRLEERVVQRTAELAQHASELERANHELDQFAYATSHDLKAPLRAIANLSQWIEEDIGDKFTTETRQQMHLLRGRVNRMEALIDGILQYSRVGRVSEEMATVDVAALLEEIVDLLVPPEKFVVEIGPGMPTLNTVQIRLSQVFSNLLSNAIKYHDRPDGRVQVTVQDIGEFYEFLVADDGPGIDSRFHDKVFLIFQTLQARDDVESTGVGLTLVKKIVEEQGGVISLESEPGQGARFRFTWPKHARMGN